ncbi:MAG: inositol 2-dehydrogenase [Alphaproteobacteria bacterium]
MDNIKFGAVGLGRLGKQHAENLATKIPGANLVAVCALEDNLLAESKEKWGVETYKDFDEMLKNTDLDAVLLSSPSHLHCVQIEKALDAGLHVFCEKPLGTSLQECKKAEAAVARHPDKVFMLGFMRRYDPSYAEVKRRIDAGEIGRPILFRGYGQDGIHAIDGYLKFAGHSGGQFIDMAVHDIDLARWFIGSEPKKVWAIGDAYAYPEVKQYNDGDNCAAMMQCEDGTMVFLFVGRTAPHGYNVESEIIGTKGTLRIASVPQRNMVEILDAHGVRKECSQDFLERFEQAYLNEVTEFVNCIREGRKPGVDVSDGTKTTVIAYACKESFESGKLVDIV